MKLTRRNMIAASAASSGIFLAGPGRSVVFGAPIGDEGGEPVDGGELVVSISELPDTLDPHRTGAAVTSTVMRQATDPLIRKNFDGEFVPGLATEWEISEDGLTWTFKLREDVSFHDGTPLNAEAVKASFDRILDPETNAVSARTQVGSMSSTEVIDEFTFSFTTDEPFAPLLNNLSSALLSPISVAAANEMGADFGQTPVGTGPWIVEEWRTGDRITMRRNPDYNWGPDYFHEGPAHIETIVFQSIMEEASRVAAFETGETHQLSLPAIDIPRMSESGEYNVVNYLRLGAVFFEFNIHAAPFDDILVRQALNHAIDPADVMAAAIEEYGQVIHGFLPPSLFGYWEGIEDYAYDFNPETASSLLAEAGYTETDDDGYLTKDGERLSFTILNLPTDAWGRAAQVAQSQLKDVGVEMQIQQMEFATLLDEAKAMNHQAIMMGYTSGDPDIAFTWFHSSNAGPGLNMSHIKDDELDAMIEAGRTEMDLDARAEIYAEIQRFLVDQAVWVPLWADQYYIAFNKRLKNASFHDDGYAVYFDAWID